MPILPVRNLGQYGIVADQSKYALPASAFTNGRNVQFDTNYVRRVSAPEDTPISTLTNAVWGAPVSTNGQRYWISATGKWNGTGVEQRVQGWDGAAYADLSRPAGYGTSYENLWHMGLYGGMPVLNNVHDVPQFWWPISMGQVLQDLTNWDPTWRTQVLRPYRGFLVAANVTKGVDQNRYLIKWSDIADPGTLPDWDETDPTKLAGERSWPSACTCGYIDAVRLGDFLMLYTTTSVLRMVLIQDATYVFDFKDVLYHTGAAALNCVRPFRNGAWHAVATGNDLIIHDGSPTSVRSVMTGRLRRWMNSNLASDLTTMFMATDVPRNEVLLGFPSTNEAFPRLGIVWNWEHDTTTVREFPQVSHVAAGVVPTQQLTWDGETALQWDSNMDQWDPLVPGGFNAQLVAFTGEEGAPPQLLNTANTTTPSPCWVERQSFPYYPGQDGGAIPDIFMRKQLHSLRPLVTQGSVTVRFGVQEEPGEAFVWQTLGTAEPGTGRMDLEDVSGRLFSFRFEGRTGEPWVLEGYDLDMSAVGYE